MVSSPQTARRLSTSVVKPSPHVRRRCDLTHWDLSMFNAHYIQKGLLFSNHSHSLTTDQIIHTLNTSLTVALNHFYPLSGRLVTDESYDTEGNVDGLFIYIDCNAQGAEFIHAVADDVSVSDVLSPGSDVPAFVRSFFGLDGAINYDGHTEPLLSVQLTELVDGFFLGVCFNHVVGDGTSYWNFFKTWAEIARNGPAGELSQTPSHDRWFYDNVVPPIKLPFRHPDEFVRRFKPPLYREKMFHLPADLIARLKTKVNEELRTKPTGSPISSLQSVGAVLWRCITRARGLPADQKTSCRLAIHNRARLRPPLSPQYFGNSIYAIAATTTAGELLSGSIAGGAVMLHGAVAGHTDSAIRGAVGGWMERPIVYDMGMFDKFSVMLGSSPRFDAYGCEFGWGKAVGARSAGANKFDGKVSLYPGWEGGGSMDLEICLVPEYMERFERDEEFLSVVGEAVELGVMVQKKED